VEGLSEPYTDWKWWLVTNSQTGARFGNCRQLIWSEPWRWARNWFSGLQDPYIQVSTHIITYKTAMQSSLLMTSNADAMLSSSMYSFMQLFNNCTLVHIFCMFLLWCLNVLFTYSYLNDFEMDATCCRQCKVRGLYTIPSQCNRAKFFTNKD